MFNRFFTPKNKIQKFWKWFTDNEGLYFDLDKADTALFAILKKRLSAVHPDLVFEFSVIQENGMKEFIISAGGMKGAFPSVNKLVDNAPILKRWKIIAFRQPHPQITQIYYKNLTIKIDDVFFKYSNELRQVSIELNIRGFNESPEWTAASFLILDTILGEYNTGTAISGIEIKELDENEIQSLLPITSLPKVIETLQFELNN